MQQDAKLPTVITDSLRPVNHVIASCVSTIEKIIDISANIVSRWINA